MTPTNLRNEYFGMEYTAYDKNFKIEGKYLNYKTRFGRGYSMILPPGTWQIVCLSGECTEEQAASIVQIISNGKISGRPQYRRYDRGAKDTPARMWTRDSRHALETLLISKGLNPQNTLILKQV